MTEPEAKDVLDFWFSECGYTDWYKCDPTFDQLIRDRFMDIYLKLRQNELDHWIDNPENAVAAIVVLDQFSRNMFRGTRDAFAADAQAVALSKEAIKRGYLDRLESQRMKEFLVVPHMHSENLDDHTFVLPIYEQPQESWQKLLKYELQHKAIIERFGQYPHRNPILGRVSTAEEEDFNINHMPEWARNA